MPDPVRSGFRQVGGVPSTCKPYENTESETEPALLRGPTITRGGRNRPRRFIVIRTWRNQRFVGEGGVATTLFEKRLSARERLEPDSVERLRGEAELLEALGGRVAPGSWPPVTTSAGRRLRTEKVPFPTLAQRLDTAAAGGVAALDSALDRARARGLRSVRCARRCTSRPTLGEPLAIVHADLSALRTSLSTTTRDARRAPRIRARLVARRSPSRDGAFRGTLAYCAPETARGEPPRRSPTISSRSRPRSSTPVHGCGAAERLVLRGTARGGGRAPTAR